MNAKKKKKVRLSRLEEKWPEFLDALRARMEAGAKEYGDASYTRPAEELASEIEEELLDVAGWSFFLWIRIRDIKQALKNMESRNESSH